VSFTRRSRGSQKPDSRKRRGEAEKKAGRTYRVKGVTRPLFRPRKLRVSKVQTYRKKISLVGKKKGTTSPAPNKTDSTAPDKAPPANEYRVHSGRGDEKPYYAQKKDMAESVLQNSRSKATSSPKEKTLHGREQARKKRRNHRSERNVRH